VHRNCAEQGRWRRAVGPVCAGGAARALIGSAGAGRTDP
jgi:hypothetical protein